MHYFDFYVARSTIIIANKKNKLKFQSKFKVERHVCPLKGPQTLNVPREG